MTGDEAYARRLAMSQGVAPAPTLNPVSSAPPPTETGEEAFQRRLALSQTAGIAAPTANFQAPERSESPASASAFTMPSAPERSLGEADRQTVDPNKLKQAQNAAAAVLAKFAKLAPTIPTDAKSGGEANTPDASARYVLPDDSPPKKQ